MASVRIRNNAVEIQIRRRGARSVTRTFPVSQIDEARTWAAQVEGNIAAMACFEGRARLRLTLGDLLDRYLTDITPLKKGSAAETWMIRALRRDPIADVLAVHALPPVLAAFRDRRLAEVSPATVNRQLNLLSHLFAIARTEWGMPIDNPVASIRRPRRMAARFKPVGRLSAAQEQRLLEALCLVERGADGRLQSGARNPWVWSVVVLALETAMRRSEIIGLRWSWIDLDSRVVELPDTKNGHGRSVPLSPRALRVLQQLPRDGTDAVILTSGDAVKKVFERARVRADLPQLRFHDLRHIATGRLADILAGAVELASVTGHRDPRTLQHYYQSDAAALARKLARFRPAAQTAPASSYLP